MSHDTISRLIEELSAAGPEEAQAVIHALVSLGPAVVPYLLHALKGERRSLRRYASMVLQQLQPQEALPPLLELLSEDATLSESRGILVGVLIELLPEGESELSTQLPEVTALLHRLSYDAMAEIRRHAAVGLAKVHFVGAHETLCILARDPDEAVRLEAQAQLVARFHRWEAHDIQPFDAVVLEAAARIRVRNGLSFSRQEALQELLTQQAKATRDILPYLEDVSTKTLQEVTPLLKEVKGDKAQLLLVNICSDVDNEPQRRLNALQCLHQLYPGEDFLLTLYRAFLADASVELRRAALEGLVEAQVEEQLQLLGEALYDEDPKLREQAARWMSERVRATDKSALGPLLGALHKYPQSPGRLAMLEALSQVLSGSPGDALFLPEIIELLEPRDEAGLAVLLKILDALTQGPSSSTRASRMLVALFDELQSPRLIEHLLAILLRILPNQASGSFLPLFHLLERFESMPIRAFVMRLLTRIAEPKAIETLIEYAASPGPLQPLVRQLLEQLEEGPFEVWPEGESYRYEPVHLCRCGQRLCWQRRSGREELRCPYCDKEYIYDSSANLMAVSEIAAPLCTCPPCARKEPLVVAEQGLLRCPHSGLRYTTRWDNRTLLLLDGLEHGVCDCCTPPQPKELQQGTPVCIRMGLRPHDTAEFRVHASSDTWEFPVPSFEVQNTPPPASRVPATASKSSPRLRSLTRPLTPPPTRSSQLRQALLTDVKDD